MRVVFRASASKEIGSGHVMRLLPLVDAFVQEGIQVKLIFDIYNLPWLERYLLKHRYSEFEATESELFVDNFEDILVIDSYTLSPTNPFIEVSKWRFVVAIIDEQSPHYRANMYVHPGLSERKILWASDKLHYGPKYLLIRNSIRSSKRIVRSDDEFHEEYAVVAGGGSDPNLFVSALTKYLQVTHPLLKLHIFTSAQSPKIEGDLVLQHDIGADYESWLKNATWAFLPSSTMAFESLALGIPTAIVQSVENQKENYEELSKLGWATPIGLWTTEFGWIFDKNAIEVFLNPKLHKSSHNRKVAPTIDFDGAKRIFSAIINGINSTEQG